MSTTYNITKIIKRLGPSIDKLNGTYNVYANGRVARFRMWLANFLGVTLVEKLLYLSLRAIPAQKIINTTGLPVFLRPELVESATRKIPDRSVDNPGYGSFHHSPNSDEQFRALYHAAGNKEDK